MPCQDFGSNQAQHNSAARSQHPDGVHLVFGDGHVSFLTGAIDFAAWQSLGGIDDGQVVQVNPQEVTAWLVPKAARIAP